MCATTAITGRGFVAEALAGSSLHAATTASIVDSHAHVWKKDARFPWAAVNTKQPDQDATAETLLDLMKRSGELVWGTGYPKPRWGAAHE